MNKSYDSFNRLEMLCPELFPGLFLLQVAFVNALVLALLKHPISHHGKFPCFSEVFYQVFPAHSFCLLRYICFCYCQFPAYYLT